MCSLLAISLHTAVKSSKVMCEARASVQSDGCVIPVQAHPTGASKFEKVVVVSYLSERMCMSAKVIIG